MSDSKRNEQRAPLSGIGEESLAPEAIDRIAARIAHEGPVVMRRARRQWTALRAGAVGVASFAAVWLWSSRNERTAPSEAALPAIARGRVCETWTGPQLELATR